MTLLVVWLLAFPLVTSLQAFLQAGAGASLTPEERKSASKVEFVVYCLVAALLIFDAFRHV